MAESPPQTDAMRPRARELGREAELLYGLLALQNGLVAREELVAAVRAWLGGEDTPHGRLDDRLRGRLGPDADALLRGLVRHHLSRHGDDPAASLAALAPDPTLADELAACVAAFDVELAGTLASLGGPPLDPDATTAYASGAARDAAEATTASATELATPVDPDATTEPGSDATGLHDPDATTEVDLLLAAADGAGPHPRRGNGAAEPAASVGAVNRFDVIKPFARGNLGVVYLAHQRELNRVVALKEIRATHARLAESRAQFVLEAEITGGLEHPNIVPIYSLGKHPDGRPFYTMRLIRGDTLREAITRYHALPADAAEARSLEFRQLLGRFVAVCHAIAYAHARGIIHRDIKPSNVMLGPYGETLVVDWGLARPVATPDDASPSPEPPLLPSPEAHAALTIGGTIKGTPTYMSPEQASGGDVGCASDIYSLGATLYCLLTGAHPVPGHDTTTVLARVRRGEFPPPRQVLPAIPPAIEAVCLRAMANRPEQRYASPRALAEDVERFLADEPVSAYTEPWPARLARWERKHRNLVRAAGAATAAVALVAIAAALLIEQARQATDTARGEAVASARAERQARQEEARARAKADASATAERQAREEEARARAAAETARAEAEANFRTSRELTALFVPILEQQLPLMSLSETLRGRLAREAADRYRAFAGARPTDPEILREGYGVLRIAANIHRLLEHVDPSPGALYDEAAALLDRLEAVQPDPARNGPARVLLMTDRGAWQIKEGRLRAGADEYRRALEQARALAAAPARDDDDDDVPDPRFALAVALWNLASAETSLGHLDDARSLASSAATLAAELAGGPRPNWMRNLVRVRVAIVKAQAERLAGDFDSALATLAPAAVWAEALAKDQPLQPDAIQAVADVQMERLALAVDFPDRPRPADLERTSNLALQRLGQLYQQHTGLPHCVRGCAEGYALRSDLRRTVAQPDLSQARADAAKALELVERHLVEPRQKANQVRHSDHSARAEALAAAARIEAAAGKPDAARDLAAKAAAAYEAALKLDPDRWLDRRALDRLRTDLPEKVPATSD